LLLGFTIVPEGNAFIVERFGKYCSTWRKGLHYKLPLIYRIANKMSLKEQVYNFSSQSLITQDKIAVKLDAIIYFHIVYPKLCNYEVENPLAGLESVASMSIKDVIGDMTQDYILSSRDAVNSQIEFVLNEAIHNWGIKITRVRTKNIMLPGEHLGLNTKKRDLAFEQQHRANVLDQVWQTPSEPPLKQAIFEQNPDKEVFCVPPITNQPKNGMWGQVEDIQNTFINDLNETDRKFGLGLASDYSARAESVFAAQKALASTLEMLKSSSETDKILANKMLDLFQSVADGRTTENTLPT
jgi:hypothetical protein